MARKKAIKEEVGKKLSLIKKAYKLVKTWIEGNGIEGFLGLIVGLLDTRYMQDSRLAYSLHEIGIYLKIGLKAF